MAFVKSCISDSESLYLVTHSSVVLISCVSVLRFPSSRFTGFSISPGDCLFLNVCICMNTDMLIGRHQTVRLNGYSETPVFIRAQSCSAFSKNVKQEHILTS